MFSFFSKDKPPYLLQDIKIGKLLQHAKNASVNRFFDTWIRKRPRKILSGSWIILHENDCHIYWGKPYHKSGWSSKLWVDEFYRTDKIALIKQIPDYNQITAYVIRVKLQDIIRNTAIEYKRVQIGWDFEVKLIDDKIEIKTKATITNQDDTKTNAYFYVQLQTEDLHPIKTEKISITDV